MQQELDWSVREPACQSSRLSSSQNYPQTPSNLKQLLSKQLKQYQDLNNEQFIILDELDPQNPMTTLANPKISKPSLDSYMNQHKTVVPIGIHYQAILPKFLSAQQYKAASQNRLKMIKEVKLNDAIQGEMFYKENGPLIEERYGGIRSYNDLNLVKLAYDAYAEYGMGLEEYLNQNNQYWAQYFKEKDRLLIKKEAARKKKRRSRGTIPI